ncbi:MarR family winged helix-turn-helix transcriptional regulator [Kitasatospora sp. SUK 42]|uniref:MarR family winged helix-turn-helix transcriptional regulator n=1 Tax=Kitasatospora sp. SUK 42 TaxID=1588882 RepID=UPI0018CA4EC8|nr:MarR family transcriptional regulator [Kitasatospora sp. SUK 42]MBV2156673.1 MarR family transcriptional regulator [Kitasatospora sp. SUK 42]
MTESAPPTPAQLMDQLARAAAAYYRHFAVASGEHGLTLMQGKVLGLLRRPMPMRTLAELLVCDASNVTGIVDRLQARDLVRRETDPADRRIKNVVLTTEGERTVERIRARLTTDLTALEQLDDEDRRAFQRLLGQVFP